MAKTKHPKDKPAATTKPPATAMPAEAPENPGHESMTPARDAPHAAPAMGQPRPMGNTDRPEEERERRTSLKDKQRNQRR